MRSHRRSQLFGAIAALGALALLAPARAGAQERGVTVATPGKYDSGYLVFSSADSAFQYWLDGRVQIDAAFYRGSSNPLGSGTDVRRARLGWKATLFRTWHGEIDVDFASNAVEMKDMWLGYIGFRNTLLRVGQYKEPFSLETLTSSKYITFVERSYIDNLSPDRHIGVGASRNGEWWYVTGGVFGQAAGTVDESGRGEGYAYTGRLVLAPINKDGRLFHIGGAMSRRTPDAAMGADTNTVRFRARPETWISKARFLTTGKIRSTDYTVYSNAELAATYGPALLQAEYSKVDVHRLDTLRTASFGGGYVMASMMLTGEHRPYSIEDAEFGRVIPKSSIGAWELAARWSTLDLNDPSTGVNIKGGRGNNVTVGLNWHVNANFKWMLDYVRVNNDNNAKPDLGPGPFKTGDKFTIIQTRCSLAF